MSDIFLGNEIMVEHQPMSNAATPAESMDTVRDLLLHRSCLPKYWVIV